MRSGGASWPISSSIFITSALAPPCSGPLSVPMPATTAECMSVSVAAATRAAKVEAFSSWSACSVEGDVHRAHGRLVAAARR